MLQVQGYQVHRAEEFQSSRYSLPVHLKFQMLQLSTYDVILEPTAGRLKAETYTSSWIAYCFSGFWKHVMKKTLRYLSFETLGLLC